MTVEINSRAEEESRIAISWLRRLESIVREQDPVFLEECLQQASLAEDYANAEILVRMDQLDAVQLHARRRYPNLTLRMYAASDLLDLGLIGYAMAASGTVQKAFEIAMRYHHVTSDRYQLELLQEDERAVIRQQPFLTHLSEHVDMGEELAGAVKILTSVVGNQADHRAIRVNFAYAAPNHVESYQETFPGAVRFDCEHSEITFPLTWLTLPVTTANEYTSALCASMCERVLGPAQSKGQTSDMIKRLLVSRAGREMPALEEAAEALRMSTSQLRKRLYREQTSYKQLVLEVRMALAAHYLEATSLSIQEIAYLLDYSQASPFSRAFKRFFGYPPLAVREGVELADSSRRYFSAGHQLQ